MRTFGNEEEFQFLDPVSLVPANVGAELDVGHVAQVDGSAVLVRADGDLFNVGDLLDVPEATHHVLASGELNHATAHVVVPASHGLNDSI